MRNHEPSLSVSHAASNVSEAGINHTVDHALTREESIYRPKIARGYIKGKGWCYGVLTESGPFFGSFDTVKFAAEREWATIQLDHSAEIARDFALVDAIDKAETAKGVRRECSGAKVRKCSGPA